MLQNEPLVAKLGVAKAKNEPIIGWIELVQLSRCNSSMLSLRSTQSDQPPRRIVKEGRAWRRFGLARADVLPYGDLAVQKAVRRLYGAKLRWIAGSMI